MSNAPPPPQGVWQPAPAPVAPNGQPLADFGNRLLALLIDYALYLAVSLILVVPFMIWWMVSSIEIMQRSMDTPTPEFPFWELYLPMMIYIVIATIVGLAYTYAYFVEFALRRGGQTIGKRAMKLRVIPVDPSAELTRLHMVKRWAVQWAAASFVPLFFYLDGLWQLWDKPLQQCLHDKAAETVVVRIG